MHHFHGFTLRPAEATDLDLAREWTAADPDHCETTRPEFWIESGAGTDCCVLEDAGSPVFFFKTVHMAASTAYREGTRTVGLKAQRCLELHIQFAPGGRGATRLRTMQGLVVGFAWLKKILSAQGYDAVYFVSKNPRLIRFCETRLGFVRHGNLLKGYITHEAEDGKCIEDHK